MRHSLPRPKSSSVSSWHAHQAHRAQAVLELRAAQHRSALTPSEARLWAALSSRQLGVSFRRQIPLGRYIADFLAPTARLVVEVDGASHRGRVGQDGRRDHKLARLGHRVLRIDAALVMQAVEAAVALVRAALDDAP